MNLGKPFIVLILLFSVLGIFTFADSLTVVSAQNESPDSTGGQTWITSTPNVYVTSIVATIKVTIKNTKDHVQYFKVSQSYHGNLENGTIYFTADQSETNPTAEFMINNANNGSNPDLGWPIQAGETKTVCFTLRSHQTFAIVPSNPTDNTFWPLIPDLGIAASWFMPNELETLNPSLEMQSWKGTFTFTATNNGSSKTVNGIIRAPIVPTDSKLTFSDPQATFVDEDMAFNTNVAAWDASFPQNVARTFTYVYEWPTAANSNTTGNGQNLFPVTAANNTTTVPTQDTGAPYGLLVLAVIIVGAGLGYAKFLR